MPLPSVSVVIVNWNAGDALIRCIESVIASKQTAFRLDEVVVVDNASSPSGFDPASVARLSVRLVENRSNRGFAAACNQGAALVNSQFLLFLNPDTAVSSDAINSAVTVLAQPSNKLVGICGIQLSTPSGQPSTCCARFPSLAALLVESSGIGRLFRWFDLRRLLTGKDLKHSQTVDQVIGAFFLVRSSLFGRLSGFDERFFVYYEEVDFSLRAKAEGFSSYYLADATATHIGGECSGAAKDLRLAYSVQSRLMFAHKHFGISGAILVALIAFTIEPLARLFQGAIAGSWVVIRDTCFGYGHLAIAMISRRQKYGCLR
jgi:N-acetylglucosaminyl-diphospho-decaprenol L-rhamnosyltransferase